MARRPRKTPAASGAEAEVAVSDSAAARTLVLGETLDLNATRDLAAAFLAARGSEIVVDAAQVRHLGAQCGQVLVSAARTWTADKRAFSFANSSDSFADGLRLLGLEAALSTKELTR